MKILLAAASYASNISGIQRHACNVAHCLLQQPEVSAVHFVIAPWQRELVQASLKPDARLHLHTAAMERSALSRNLWHYQKLPKLAAELNVDLVHLTYPVPVNAAALHCPTALTLHDMYPYEIPRNFGFPKFLFNRLILKQCIREVDAIACVSDATRCSLGKYSPSSVQQKVVRIYNCVEPYPACSSQSPVPDWQGEPFLLCVAQHRHNKNLLLLIRSFHRLLQSNRVATNMRLVILGIAAQETRKLYKLVSTLNLGEHVSFLEGISEPELQWCYTHCEAVVAPSLTEGFGLPVAEGLLAGARVVCSDIQAHREVGDGQCLFVALGQNAEADLVEAIVEALTCPKGKPVALPQFSTRILARQYISFYRRLVSFAPIGDTPVSALIDVAQFENMASLKSKNRMSMSRSGGEEHERI